MFQGHLNATMQKIQKVAAGFRANRIEMANFSWNYAGNAVLFDGQISIN